MEQISVDYKARVNGRFTGILRWPQFEQLWRALENQAEGWYVYEPEAAGPPAEPISKQQFLEFLASTDDYLRAGCTKNACGVVYADSLEQPQFVKIYNPQLMGGCGTGKAPLPQWLLSRVAPESLI